MQFEDKYLKDLVKPIKLNSSIKVELSAATNTAVIFVPDINRLTSLFEIENIPAFLKLIEFSDPSTLRGISFLLSIRTIPLPFFCKGKSEKYEIEYKFFDLSNKKYKKTLSRFLPMISFALTMDFVVFAFEARKQDPLFEAKTDQSRYDFFCRNSCPTKIEAKNKKGTKVNINLKVFFI